MRPGGVGVVRGLKNYEKRGIPDEEGEERPLAHFLGLPAAAWSMHARKVRVRNYSFALTNAPSLSRAGYRAATHGHRVRNCHTATCKMPSRYKYIMYTEKSR